MISALFFSGALAAGAVQALLWGAVGHYTALGAEGDGEGAVDLTVLLLLAVVATAGAIALAMLAGGLR